MQQCLLLHKLSNSGHILPGSVIMADSDSELALSSELDEEDEQVPDLPYPGFVQISLKYLDQTSRPRNWCLFMITNPYPFQYDNNSC
ncbi:hypothetical protein GE061_007076 [Apolygus lucorum]|uniref:Uncharacterized protein n=1 Tax=Apolygus lucorum TaxID=248454 RepID=A0A8S9WSG2_APOLU|nr:hypothetical protein GE061_007076 [Apolygus lucorum]